MGFYIVVIMSEVSLQDSKLTGLTKMLIERSKSQGDISVIPFT